MMSVRSSRSAGEITGARDVGALVGVAEAVEQRRERRAGSGPAAATSGEGREAGLGAELERRGTAAARLVPRGEERGLGARLVALGEQELPLDAHELRAE